SSADLSQHRRNRSPSFQSLALSIAKSSKRQSPHRIAARESGKNKAKLNQALRRSDNLQKRRKFGQQCSIPPFFIERRISCAQSPIEEIGIMMLSSELGSMPFPKPAWLSAQSYRRKLIACGLLAPKRFYLKKRGGMIFWRFGSIGGSFFFS